MNTKWLEYLVTVVDCGSITEAARQLYISQPALTKIISSLEKEYGYKLLERNRTGVTLTREGKNFLYYAKRVVNATTIMEANCKEAKAGTDNSRVFVASLDLEFLKSLLVDTYLNDHAARVHYILNTVDRMEVVWQVLHMKAMLGILVINDADGASVPWRTNLEELDMIQLDSYPLQLAVGPLSPLYQKDKAFIEEVNKYPSLALDMGGIAKQELSLDNRLDAISHKRILFTNSTDTAKEFLLNTGMSMFISKWAVSRFQNDKIKILPIYAEDGRELPVNRLIMIKRKGYQMNRAERRLSKRIFDYFNVNPDENWK